MHILIIQPPDFSRDFADASHDPEAVTPFAPAWDILKLMGYLREKTRYTLRLLDLRLYESPEQTLQQALEEDPAPGAALLLAETTGFGFSTGILELLKRHAPNLPVALFGPQPTAFLQETMQLPSVQFAVCGDPERPVQLLLDTLDLPARWKRIPGLAYAGHLPETPHWDTAAHHETRPAFDLIFWPAYRREFQPHAVRIAEMRISRGHTGLPCDQHLDLDHAPFHVYSLEGSAKALAQCNHLEIDLIKLLDPPGCWTPDRLKAWCSALSSAHNGQGWTFTMLPAVVHELQAEELAAAECRHVEFCFPAASMEGLKAFGCILEPEDLSKTVERLSAFGVGARFVFYLAGPYGGEQETSDLLRWIRSHPEIPFSLLPTPLLPASAMYRTQVPLQEQQFLDQQLRWARAPWMATRPVPVWRGEEGVEEARRIVQVVRKQSKAGVASRLRSNLRRWMTGQVFRDFEEKASHWLPSILPARRD